MVKLTVRCASQPAVAAPRRVAPTTLSPAERLAAGERLKKSGNDAYGRGDAAGAVERWVEAVDALRGAGGAARLLGEPAAAAVAVACLSNCARARLELGGAAGDGDGAAAAALEDANGALALDGDNVKARFQRARALARLGRVDDAADAVAWLENREPANAAVRALAARVAGARAVVAAATGAALAPAKPSAEDAAAEKADADAAFRADFRAEAKRAMADAEAACARQNAKICGTSASAALRGDGAGDGAGDAKLLEELAGVEREANALLDDAAGVAPSASAAVAGAPVEVVEPSPFKVDVPKTARATTTRAADNNKAGAAEAADNSEAGAAEAADNKANAAKTA